MTGVLSKFRLKVPSSQRDDSYSSSQRNDSHGTFHITRNIPYNKENKGIYYSNINSKVVTSIFDPRFNTATVVVKRNSTRQAINRARLWHFDTRDACNDTGECVYTDGPSKWNHGHCY